MSNSWSGVSRRQFLGRSACNAAGLAAGLVGLAAHASPSTSNEIIRIGVIGVRRQGRKLALELCRQTNAVVASICDVDRAVLDRAARELHEAGASPHREEDFRRLIDDSSVDAIVVATPDHSHAAIAIEALRAGKHVYLETPVCHTLEETTTLIEAAKQARRIVQSGSFERSLPHVRSAIEFIQSGGLGDVPLAKAWAVHRRPVPTPSLGPVAAPAGVDYAAWLFPTPERPFDIHRFHRSWSAFWEYGSGELGTWGVPLLDVARWGLGLELPNRISACGGQVADGPAEAPDTLHVSFSYPRATLIWEHRQWSNHPPEGRNAGVAFYGDRGTLVLDRGGWKVYDSNESIGEDGRAELGPHLADFLDAIRHGREPSAPLSAGITTASLCHLGNLAYRLDREIRLDSSLNELLADPEVAALAQQRYRTLL